MSKLPSNYVAESFSDTAAVAGGYCERDFACTHALTPHQNQRVVSQPNAFTAYYADTLGADGSAPALEDPAASPLLRHAPVTGRCRVLCYHPDHHQSLATLPPARQREVVGAWIDQQRELGPAHAWVQIFENRGRMMGCSSDHPHGQIWASDHVPSLPATEDAAQARYLSSHGRPLLLDYAEREAALGTRVVTANEGWLAVVPWWAAWPFETLLLPRMPLGGLEDLDAAGADRR